MPLNKKPTLPAFLRRFQHQEKGGILVEFALIFPVLVALLMGCLELTLYIYTSQKIQRAATTAADLTSRTIQVDQNELDNIFAAANQVAAPFNFDANARIFVSAIEEGNNGNPTIAWQENQGSLAQPSLIGQPNGQANLSDPALIAGNNSVIIAEAFYMYTPMFTGFIGEQSIRHQAIFRPRLSITVERVN